MFNFLWSMWDWLPAPFAELFYFLVVFMILWAIISVVVRILDMIPFV